MPRKVVPLSLPPSLLPSFSPLLSSTLFFFLSFLLFTSCINHLSLGVRKHHGQDNPQKEELPWGSNSRGSIANMTWGTTAGPRYEGSRHQMQATNQRENKPRHDLIPSAVKTCPCSASSSKASPPPSSLHKQPQLKTQEYTRRAVLIQTAASHIHRLKDFSSSNKWTNFLVSFIALKSIKILPD